MRFNNRLYLFLSITQLYKWLVNDLIIDPIIHFLLSPMIHQGYPGKIKRCTSTSYEKHTAISLSLMFSYFSNTDRLFSFNYDSHYLINYQLKLTLIFLNERTWVSRSCCITCSKIIPTPNLIWVISSIWWWNAAFKTSC